MNLPLILFSHPDLFHLRQLEKLTRSSVAFGDYQNHYFLIKFCQKLGEDLTEKNTSGFIGIPFDFEKYLCLFKFASLKIVRIKDVKIEMEMEFSLEYRGIKVKVYPRFEDGKNAVKILEYEF